MDTQITIDIAKELISEILNKVIQNINNKHNISKKELQIESFNNYYYDPKLKN